MNKNHSTIQQEEKGDNDKEEENKANIDDNDNLNQKYNNSRSGSSNDNSNNININPSASCHNKFKYSSNILNNYISYHGMLCTFHQAKYCTNSFQNGCIIFLEVSKIISKLDKYDVAMGKEVTTKTAMMLTTPDESNGNSDNHYRNGDNISNGRNNPIQMHHHQNLQQQYSLLSMFDFGQYNTSSTDNSIISTTIRVSAYYLLVWFSFTGLSTFCGMTNLLNCQNEYIVYQHSSEQQQQSHSCSSSSYSSEQLSALQSTTQHSLHVPICTIDYLIQKQIQQQQTMITDEKEKDPVSSSSPSSSSLPSSVILIQRFEYEFLYGILSVMMLHFICPITNTKHLVEVFGINCGRRKGSKNAADDDSLSELLLYYISIPFNMYLSFVMTCYNWIKTSYAMIIRFKGFFLWGWSKKKHENLVTKNTKMKKEV